MTDLSDYALELDPCVLDGRIVGIVHSIVNAEFDPLEVVSGEDGLLMTELDKQRINEEGSQRSLSEGDDSNEKPDPGDDLEKTGHFNGLGVVVANKVAHFSSSRAVSQTKDWEQVALSVGQNMECGEQSEGKKW